MQMEPGKKINRGGMENMSSSFLSMELFEMAANCISCFPIISEKCFEAMGLLLTKRQLQQHCFQTPLSIPATDARQKLPVYFFIFDV